MLEVRVGAGELGPDQVSAVAAGTAKAVRSEEVWRRIEASATYYAEHGHPAILRKKWRWLIGGEPPSRPTDVVRAFLEGHCAGVGDPLPVDEVRAVMLCRANALAAGFSGVRPVLVERLLELLDLGWTPVVPGQGSVGAAGCIALAHVARATLGLGGELWVDGRAEPAAPRIASLNPLEVTEKEALSLINGSTFATALAALAIARSRRVLDAAEAACALSMEVVRADLGALDARTAAVRGHQGVAKACERLRRLLQGSTLVGDDRRPDSFSVRCATTVLGTAREAFDHVTQVVERELAAPCDNPLVLPGEGVIEGGHFHGAPVALAMDHLKAALVQLAGMSERRTFRLTYGQLSGLPSFLVASSGVDSGLMLAQYTAASLTSEAKTQAMPGSTDTIPTVQHQEDHVSMGPIAARSALEVADRVSDVVAIELLCGAQGLDFRLDAEPPPQPGQGTARVHDAVRQRVDRWIDDRVLHTDLAALGVAVRQGAFGPEMLEGRAP